MRVLFLNPGRNVFLGMLCFAVLSLFWALTISVAAGADISGHNSDSGAHVNRVRKVAGAAVLTSDSLRPSVLTSQVERAQTFSAVYSDSAGYTNIKTVDLLIGPETGEKAIWVSYDRTANKIYLYDDSGRTPLGGCTAGSAGKIMNTQGIIDCGRTTVSGTGKSLTVNWSITPRAAFASITEKTIWMIVRGTSNRNSGWAARGTWTVNRR
jgi:hypothetical protein